GSGEGNSVRAHTVVLCGPHGEAAPPAPDVEHGLARSEPELPAHQIELVLLRLLELAVGVAVVCARVDHERIEEERVEIVGHVVMMGDGLRVPLLASCAHDGTSFMPKMESKTTRRRKMFDPSTVRTTRRAIVSGSRPIWRSSQPGSPEP